MTVIVERTLSFTVRVSASSKDLADNALDHLEEKLYRNIPQTRIYARSESGRAMRGVWPVTVLEASKKS